MYAAVKLALRDQERRRREELVQERKRLEKLIKLRATGIISEPNYIRNRTDSIELESSNAVPSNQRNKAITFAQDTNTRLVQVNPVYNSNSIDSTDTVNPTTSIKAALQSSPSHSLEEPPLIVPVDSPPPKKFSKVPTVVIHDETSDIGIVEIEDILGPNNDIKKSGIETTTSSNYPITTSRGSVSTPLPRLSGRRKTVCIIGLLIFFIGIIIFSLGYGIQQNSTLQLVFVLVIGGIVIISGIGLICLGVSITVPIESLSEINERKESTTSSLAQLNSNFIVPASIFRKKSSEINPPLIGKKIINMA